MSYTTQNRALLSQAQSSLFDKSQPYRYYPLQIARVHSKFDLSDWQRFTETEHEALLQGLEPRDAVAEANEMDIALWIVQGLLALLFIYAGVQKLAQSKEKLTEAKITAYAEDFSPGFLRTLGLLEVLGGIGVILPELTGILPWLTPLAAVGLALIMIGATYTRLRRGENQEAVGTIVFFLMAAFVAYGRFFLAV